VRAPLSRRIHPSLQITFSGQLPQQFIPLLAAGEHFHCQFLARHDSAKLLMIRLTGTTGHLFATPVNR